MPDTTPQGSPTPDDAPTPDENRPNESAPQPPEAPAPNDDSTDDFLDRIRMAAKQMGRPHDEDAAETPAMDIEAISLSAAIESKPAPDSDDGFAQLFVSKLAEVEQDIETRLSAKAEEPVDVMDLTAEPEPTPEPPAPAAAPPVAQEAPAGEAPPARSAEPASQEASASEEEKPSRRRRRRRGRGRKGDRADTPPAEVPAPEAAVAAEDSGASSQLSEAYHKGTLGAPRAKKRPPYIEYDAPLTMPQPNETLLAKLRKELATVETAAVVRYGAMRDIGLFTYDLDTPPTPGMKVVIRTERGVEMGKVLARLMPAEESSDVVEPDPVEAPAPAEADDTATPAEAADAPADPDSNCGSDGGCCSSDGGGCGGGCGDKSSYGKLDREQLAIFLATNGEKYSFQRGGKVLRVANTQDLADARSLEERRGEQLGFCREQIRTLSLKMRLVMAEILLGGERMVFYFTAEDRVDFRDLVKQLTTRFRTRVELRQVGARDEARLVGDYERCGRRCCCQAFVKDLLPVSMRMAKLQKATLDPSKISGRCSRLMCCLRYEDESYRELKKSLPNKSIWVRTATMVGKVLDSQVLCQLVKIRLPEGTIETVGIEEIIERDVPEPELPAMRDPRASSRRPMGQRRPLRDEPATASRSEAPAQASRDDSPRSDGKPGDRPKKRRPRRRRRKKNSDGGSPPAPSAPAE